MIFEPSQLDQKFKQHVLGRNEFGNISKNEYKRRALAHMGNPKIDTLMLKDGTIMKYNKKTNLFRRRHVNEFK